MRRFWGGLLVLCLAGCAGMDEFYFADDYHEMMVFEGDSYAAPMTTAFAEPASTAAAQRPCSSCPYAQTTPVSYVPPSTKEPPLTK